MSGLGRALNGAPIVKRGMSLSDSQGNFFQSPFVNFVLIEEIFYMHNDIFLGILFIQTKFGIQLHFSDTYTPNWIPFGD